MHLHNYFPVYLLCCIHPRSFPILSDLSVFMVWVSRQGKKEKHHEMGDRSTLRRRTAGGGGGTKEDPHARRARLAREMAECEAECEALAAVEYRPEPLAGRKAIWRGEAVDVGLRMIIVGDTKVGKTSLMQQYLGQQGLIVPTIGVDPKMVCVVRGSQTIRLNVTDVGGQKRFRPFLSGSYVGSHIVMLVFDITKRDSFDSIDTYWRHEVVEHFPEGDVSILLVGNKTDLSEDRQVSVSEANTLAGLIKCPYVEVSALNGDGVESSIEYLVDHCVDNRRGVVL